MRAGGGPEEGADGDDDVDDVTIGTSEGDGHARSSTTQWRRQHWNRETEKGRNRELNLEKKYYILIIQLVG